MVKYNLMNRNDEQLISEYLEGDEKALTVLVDRYLVGAYSFALKITHDPHIAEDATQESFTKTFRESEKVFRKHLDIII